MKKETAKEHKQAPKGETAVNRAPVKAKSQQKSKAKHQKSKISERQGSSKRSTTASNAPKSKVLAKEQILETSTSKSEVLAKHQKSKASFNITSENDNTRELKALTNNDASLAE
ncbi:28043_t:CDS:2 [Racocetra persica]|uniref:28043_t:CDS:1 n=1 Tax=Racocetra persica TaxID=160502 RepID=A0ACA9LZE6_9GLOM|nr:28043_t:CDS:2 [Racocetra persica]